MAGYDLLFTDPWKTGWETGIPILALLSLLFFRHPEAFVGLLSTQYLVFRGILLPRSTLANYLAIVAVISFLRYAFKRNYQPLKPLLSEPLPWLIILYTGWKLTTYLIFGLSDPFNENGRDYLLRDLITEIIPLFGIMLLGKDTKRIHRCLDWMCAGLGIGFILFGISFIETAIIHNYPPNLWRASVNVFRFQALSFGDYAATGFLLGCVWLNGARRGTIARKIALPFSICMLGMALLGASRALAIFFPIALAYCLLNLKKLNKNLMSWGIVIAGIILVITLFIPSANQLFTILDDRFESTMTDPNGLSARPEFYRYAFNRFLDSPVIGVGTGGGGPVVNNRPIWEPYSSSYTLTYRVQVHNYYLEVLSEQGMVGTALVVLILGRIFLLLKRSSHCTNTGRGQEMRLIAVSILILTLLGGLTGSVKFLYPSAALLWVVCLWKSEEQELKLLKPTNMLRSNIFNGTEQRIPNL